MASFVLDQVKAKGVCQIICILGGVGRARVTCTGYVHCKISSSKPRGPRSNDDQDHQSINPFH